MRPGTALPPVQTSASSPWLVPRTRRPLGCLAWAAWKGWSGCSAAAFREQKAFAGAAPHFHKHGKASLLQRRLLSPPPLERAALPARPPARGPLPHAKAANRVVCSRGGFLPSRFLLGQRPTPQGVLSPRLCRVSCWGVGGSGSAPQECNPPVTPCGLCWAPGGRCVARDWPGGPRAGSAWTGSGCSFGVWGQRRALPSTPQSSRHQGWHFQGSSALSPEARAQCDQVPPPHSGQLVTRPGLLCRRRAQLLSHRPACLGVHLVAPPGPACSWLAGRVGPAL